MQLFLVTHEATECEIVKQLAIRGEVTADVVRGEEQAKAFASQFNEATIEPLTEIEAGIFTT